MSREREYLQSLAQERMYDLAERKDALRAIISEADANLELAIEESRALLTEFPTLRFSRPRKV